MQAAEAVDRAVEITISEHPEVVRAWKQGTPKTWGFLAGQAVVACRGFLGRSLTEAERRAVWDRLWRRLQQSRAEGAGD